MVTGLTGWLFSLAGCPPLLSWFPNPRLPLFALKEVVAWFGMLTTPGSRVARGVQSRPFRGNCRTGLESTVSLMVEELVCTSGRAALTSMVWVSWPTFKLRLGDCWAPTLRG